MAAPIMWADKNTGTVGRPAMRWNLTTGKREPVVDDYGRAVRERVPATGRIGTVREVDDIKATRPMPEPRDVRFLRDDGNETNNPIRSAAAAGHGDKGTDNSFARFVLAKAAHNGWIPVGACPAAMVSAGERHELQMYAPSVRAAAKAGQGCKPGEVGANRPPCAHYLAEQAARLDKRRKEHDHQVAIHTRPEERTATALVDLVQHLAAGQQPAAPVAPASDEFAPVKGKK